MTSPDTHTPTGNQRTLQLVQETFAIEAAALQQAAARFQNTAAAAQLAQAVSTMLQAPGRVVVMGMGKSGHVGRKIAATLASTGTPAFFVHPAEAGHGDLGMVTVQDVVLAISNSGESEELARILPVLKRQGAFRLNKTIQSHGGIIGQPARRAGLTAGVLHAPKHR